jgi:hypothetical protein
MAQYLVFHTMSVGTLTTDSAMKAAKAMLDCFTTDTYCITTWAAVGSGKQVCLWEATSEQAIIDMFAKVKNILDMPIDGIYPASAYDWAEMKKTLA